MAIFKPTDCSPFNGTFDISTDLPIIFECKVDTSNSKVTGYSIEIYNSDNKLVFPPSSRSSGPIAANVTYLSDLKPYASGTFSSLIPTSKNINSGLNGTYLEIPFYVKKVDDTKGSTVPRNQMTEGLTDGQTYTWKITLYQEVTKNVFPPQRDQYYDMAVANGTVLGSTEKRIQTALIDSDDDVVDGLVLIDKFLQPIKIDELTDYSPSKPKNWTGKVPDNFSMSRSLITGYDSSYGYIYPSTAADNAFVEGQIAPENANGFQIFKNGNNPSNLGATDMVEFIYDENNFAGTMEWSTNIAKPELSYWKQTYITTDKPNGAYYPFSGDGYSAYPLAGEERIIFNAIGKSSVTFKEGDKTVYYGSPFNGIFRPIFSDKEIGMVSSENNTISAGTYVFADTIDFSKTFTSPEKLSFESNGVTYDSIKIDGTEILYGIKSTFYSVYYNEGWSNKKYKIITTITAQTVSPDFYNWFYDNTITAYEVTVTWNRTTDASNWGTLSNKIVYCRRDGKNYEINSATQIGTINETPFKFVDEKPVRLFTGKSAEDKDLAISTVDQNSGIYRIQTVNPISELISVTCNGIDITKDCIFSVGEKDIVYKTKNTVDVKTATVSYKPYNVEDYTGIIFYNSTGYLYIRPSINVNNNMIFKELTAGSSYTWFNIKDFNKDYNYIEYDKDNVNLVGDAKSFSPIPDKTRYQIKSFYKESDYNPFSIYQNPTIASTILNGAKNTNNEFENVVLNPDKVATISVRNFTVVSTYEQNSYIQWKSFQWFLYDSRKLSVLESTDEQYDGEISGTFYGLEPKTNYILSLVLQTNSGKIINVDYPILTNFTEERETHGITKIEFDCDTLSVKADVNLFAGVIAPTANKYYSKGTDAPETGTAYYYDDAANMYVKDGQTVGKVENKVLEISGNNSLEFENMFLDHEISDNTAKSNILVGKKDHDVLVLEGSFYFSENYQGNIFSIQDGKDGDTTTKSISINIPEALKGADADGFVDMEDDINKVGVTSPGNAQAYLKISNADGTVGDSWQNLLYHRTSIWKQSGTDSAGFGNRINVANFRYAESQINKNGVPYPYDLNSGSVSFSTTDGTKIYWNQLVNTNLPDLPKKTTPNGITFVNNGDGTITASGTNNDDENPVQYVILSGVNGNGIGEKGHIYMSFGCPKQRSQDGSVKYRIACTAHKSNGEYSGGVSDTGGGKIFRDQDGSTIRPLDDGEKFGVAIEIAAGYAISETDPLVFSPQIFDLTKMFGEGNEPQTVEDFWDRVAEVYFSPGLNVAGPYNSYDNTRPLKNTINPAEQSVSFCVKDENETGKYKPFFVTVSGSQTNPKETEKFCVNQPDRMVWLDYVPLPKQYPIITNANLEDGKTTVTVTTQNMSVLNDEELLMWDDNGRWKDGIYVSSGKEAATLGQVLLNGEVVDDLTISIERSSPTYSDSGLTSQAVVPEKISEREAIAGYNFSFRIFINTQDFTVDENRSRYYVSKINVTKTSEGGDLT